MTNQEIIDKSKQTVKDAMDKTKLCEQFNRPQDNQFNRGGPKSKLYRKQGRKS